MSERELSYADLLQIVSVFEASSEFSELHIKYGDIEVDLRKHGAAPEAASMQPTAARPSVPASPSEEDGPGKTVHAPVSAPVPSAAFPAGAHIVKSPMVGTFYCAPEPGATPFVKLGQRVTAETTVCIIEVMKLMNSIPAGTSGVVTHILVKDAEAVEFGQALVVIDPNA